MRLARGWVWRVRRDGEGRLSHVRCVVMTRKTMRSMVMSHGGHILFTVTPMMVPVSVAGSIMSAASGQRARAAWTCEGCQALNQLQSEGCTAFPSVCEIVPLRQQA